MPLDIVRPVELTCTEEQLKLIQFPHRSGLDSFDARPDDGTICYPNLEITLGEQTPENISLRYIGPGRVALGAVESWSDLSACRGMDPEIFFPAKGKDIVIRKKLPLAICRICPVNAECRDYAVSRYEKVGIWAGTTEHERRKLKRTAQVARVSA
jgi:WhiB family redox-sensing transcriptional regulator